MAVQLKTAAAASDMHNMSRLRTSLDAWRGWRAFAALPPAHRRITFYAEDAASWAHLGPLVEQLRGPLDREVCYLTSQPDDPVLSSRGLGLRAFFIGSGLVRTACFLGLRTDVMVMTMPDLQTYHIKRSRVQNVHYAYVFHALVSTHMMYRHRAFDHFDTLLCVGPHHLEEVRAAEALYGLRAKSLVSCGYGRLDACLERARQAHDCVEADHVLVAPSWGPNALLENHGHAVCAVLLDAGLRVTVRPHPMTTRHHGALLDALRREYGCHPKFALETDVASTASLESCAVMVSDWSGAALEFGLAFEKPVAFIDVLPKVNNPRYQELDITPLEVRLRYELGASVSPNALSELPDTITALVRDRAAKRPDLRRLRETVAFNIGCSAGVGAAAIAEIADRALEPTVTVQPA